MNTIAHPPWCSPALCTADPPSLGAAHRSDPVTFNSPGLAVVMSLHRAEPGWAADTFLIAAADHAAVTVAVSDCWRFTEALTELLARVR